MVESMSRRVEDTDEGLVRGISGRSLTANIVNQTVGSGIFVLPAVVAAILGPASVLGYVVCALFIGVVGLCFAELGSQVTCSGGTFAYIEAAFGPFVGFLAGFLMWLGGDVVLVFAFTGTEGALSASGEVQDPRRTIPRAIFSGILIITMFYIGVQIAGQGILGDSLASEQRAPLAAAVGRASGEVWRQLFLAGTLISAFGYLSGNILTAPRLLFAFAREGVVPRRFGAVHPRYRTPYAAIAARIDSSDLVVSLKHWRTHDERNDAVNAHWRMLERARRSRSRRAVGWNCGLDSARLAGGNEEHCRYLEWSRALIPKRVGACPFNEGRACGERSYSAAKAVGVVQRADARLDEHEDRTRMEVPTAGAPVGCSGLV